MARLSLEQREILKMACGIQVHKPPFTPTYCIVYVGGADMKPAQRLERRGLLHLLDEYRDHAIYMGTDKGADAIGVKRLGDEV